MAVNYEQQAVQSLQSKESSPKWLKTPRGDPGSDPGRLLSRKGVAKVDGQLYNKLLQLWYNRKYIQLQFWFVSGKGGLTKG